MSFFFPGSNELLNHLSSSISGYFLVVCTASFIIYNQSLCFVPARIPRVVRATYVRGCVVGVALATD